MSRNNQTSQQTQPGSRAQANAATDERLVRSSSPDVRGDRGVAEDIERTQSVTELSDAELDELVASEFEQMALPQAPMIPGFHLCWLTTMSKYDSIHRRERLGYTPVRYSEVPGFYVDGVASENGTVTCNEMLLYKIPEQRYQAVMRYFHHRRPMEEEAAIIAKNEEQRQQDSKGKDLLTTEGEGIDELAKQVAAAAKLRPIFS